MVAQETTLLSHYALTPPLTVSELDSPGTNNTTRLISSRSQEFVWKRYQTYSEPATLRYEHTLLRWLARQGLPFAVPEPLATRSGATLTLDGDGWQALFPRLPGSAPDRNYPAVAEAAGVALAELHAVLSAYPLQARPGVASYSDLTVVHLHIAEPWSLTPADLGLPDEPAQQELLAWWRDMLVALRTDVERVYPILPRQIVHGDVGLANTLFTGNKLTAVLDFEFACPDARAIDIASGLRSVLRTWQDDERISFAEAFCRGYGSTTRLTSHEITALPMLLLQREVVSTIWWLGRGLTTGDIADQIERIESTQALAIWLDQYGQRLVETVGPHLG